jgi:hypothetical protein
MKPIATNTRLQAALVLLVIMILFQYCKPSQQASTSTPTPVKVTVFYEKDIKPIMLVSCTPCHFPEQGKKKMLDTYASTKENINDIITRIQLPVEDEKYMPFRSKRPALTTAQIQLFQDWVKQGMAN